MLLDFFLLIGDVNKGELLLKQEEHKLKFVKNSKFKIDQYSYTHLKYGYNPFLEN